MDSKYVLKYAQYRFRHDDIAKNDSYLNTCTQSHAGCKRIFWPKSLEKRERDSQ